ncbi:universal stress protein [Corynebacterium alimapuense]|uniref:Universal stress protein n=1 Tax=Corynebacterium alimapuense TaxID=1576874 RepID=A0A3M8KBX6_9CORY|nr:universal stress protein [Corynebacterium alimapuense]RNE50064.1 universal stress protein [Corynebacterium alimapuense]
MLIAYDGSDEARRAMNYAAQLLVPTHVEVLTAWEPLQRTASRSINMSGLYQAEWVNSSEAEDPVYAKARATCQEGMDLARSLGLAPRAHLVEVEATVWSAIVDAVWKLQPDVIVSGTRATSGWRSLFQPSTSGSILQNAGIPMLIVPPEADSEDAEDSGDNS